MSENALDPGLSIVQVENNFDVSSSVDPIEDSSPDVSASIDLIQNSSPDVRASIDYSLIQDTSADVSMELGEIACAADCHSADRNEASDRMLLEEKEEEELSVCSSGSSRRQESNRDTSEGIPTLESTQRESECKISWFDDVSESANRDSADELKYEDWQDMALSTFYHTCWIKKSLPYQDQQIQKIREKQNASELLRCMNDNLENLTKDDMACYYRFWLSIATRYNHVSLVYLILADGESSRYNKEVHVRDFSACKQDPCRFDEPLLIAIKNGNESLVTAFLVAGSSVTHPYEVVRNAYEKAVYDGLRVHDVSRLKRLHDDLSGIEYAFVVNQPRIFKLLVAHYNSQHHPRDHTARPLHIVMKLAGQFSRPHFAELPALVQRIIDDGTDVDCLDGYGDTPLQVLVQYIRYTDPSEDIGAAYRSTLIDIARILLKAGAKVNTAERNPLAHFKRLMLLHGYSEMPDLPALRDHFNFVCDLGRLLLLHGADPTLFEFYWLIPDAANMILKTFTRNRERCARQISFVDDIMDALGNLFQSTLLVRPNRETDDAWNRFVRRVCWAFPIEYIAEHSSQPGRSEKFIYVLLNAFNASNLMELRDKLQRLLTFDMGPRHEVQLNHAIKYVDTVMRAACAPRSLQDLSRRAITRAMSARALLPYASVDLGLPPMLKAFVLL